MYDPKNSTFDRTCDELRWKTSQLERQVTSQQAELAKLRRQVFSLQVGQSFHTVWFLLALVLFLLYVIGGASRPG
jgi:hypothetical protein